MAESKVQLKREEIVGDEVVLQDIDPKTSTGSVVDEASGLNLNEVIARLKDDINSQLSRVVNSVNGRTGVVVLTSKDVGLGNVDNVSLADIQKWTLDELEHAFLTRGFKIYDTLDEVDRIVNDQDSTLNGSGFFTKTGRADDNDKMSYIGYFVWYEEQLTAVTTPVKNIGFADNSILYNEKAGDRDYSGGRLGVNIWKEEEGLELYNGISTTEDPKENSGLRINRDKVLPTTYYFEGCYGTNWDEPGESDDSWLYLGMDIEEIPSDAPEVIIYYDNEKLTTANQKFYSKERAIRKHDIIICSFSSKYIKLRTTEDEVVRPALYPLGICERLLNRHMARGVVTSVELNDAKQLVRYTVEFHSFKPNVMGGLVYTSQYSINDDYTNSDPDGSQTDVGGSTMNFGPYRNDALMIRLPAGAVDSLYSNESVGGKTDQPLIIDEQFLSTSNEDIKDKYIAISANGTENTPDVGPYKSQVFNANVSGLTVRENPIRAGVTNDLIDGVTPTATDGYPSPINNDWRYTNLPVGPYPSFDPRFNSKLVNYGGIGILPDASLCVIPAESYMSKFRHGSLHVTNWRADADFYIPEFLETMKRDDRQTTIDSVSSNTAFGGECLLGINLNKAVSSLGPSPGYIVGAQTTKLANLSGLKIFHAGAIPTELMDPDGEDIIPSINGHQMTGGLAINCGKGLKIEPAHFYDTADEFYDGGKLVINFDDFDSGLEEDEEGKLTVSVGMGKGIMKYNDTNTIGINLKKSALGFNSAGAPDINVLKQWTGLDSRYFAINSETVNLFKATGSYYEMNGGVACAKALAINTGDGIKIDTKNAVAVKTTTKSKKLVDGQLQKDKDGNFIYNSHGHGLTIYADESATDKKDQFTDEYYTGGAIGVQVRDPGTNESHGITINEHGTLCVDLSSAGGSGNGSNPGSTIADEIKENLKLDEWTITGNEIVTVNNIPQTDPTKVTYTYNPSNEPLNIKLGKGLIFIDERGLNDNDEDEDGCGCPGCKCNYCDYVVNIPGKEKYQLVEWIQSNGKQRIDLDLKFSSDNTHIFSTTFMHIIENDKAFADRTEIIFAAGRLNAIGTQYLIKSGNDIRAGVINRDEAPVESVTGPGTKITMGKRVSATVTYKVTDMLVKLVHENDADAEEPTREVTIETGDCESDGLTVSLISLFGVPEKLGGNMSTNARITMYGFKIYEKSMLKCIADLIPVVCIEGARKGAAGLFDKVSNVFYPNAMKLSNGAMEDFNVGPELETVLNHKGEDITEVSPEKAITYIGLRHITTDTMTNRIIINESHLNPEAKKRTVQFEFVNIHGGGTIKRQDIMTIGDGSKGTQRIFMAGPGGIAKAASVVDGSDTEVTVMQSEASAIGTDMRTFIGLITFSKLTNSIICEWDHIDDEASQSIIEDGPYSDDFGDVPLASGPITLFSSYNNSAYIDNPALIRVYSIRIYEDDKPEPVIDLKPVIRSDNIVGLLDIVNKEFHIDNNDSLFAPSRETTGAIYNWKAEEVVET